MGRFREARYLTMSNEIKVGDCVAGDGFKGIVVDTWYAQQYPHIQVAREPTRASITYTKSKTIYSIYSVFDLKVISKANLIAHYKRRRNQPMLDLIERVTKREDEKMRAANVARHRASEAKAIIAGLPRRNTQLLAKGLGSFNESCLHDNNATVYINTEGKVCIVLASDDVDGDDGIDQMHVLTAQPAAFEGCTVPFAGG